MTDIKDFILQLEDTNLSLEEQQAALLMIEQTLIENKQIQEKSLEENSSLIVDAVKVIEDRLDAKFTELKTDPKLKGPKGDQGIRGENGKTGSDGLNGRDGADGKDGVDGVDGKDGRYVVDAEIDLDDTLLITLSDGTKIKTTKEIKGAKGDQGPQGLRGSPGIGLSSGGTTGQVLVKNSSNDYDTSWTNTPGLDLASPDAIGDVTPNTGAFTSLTSTSGALNGSIGATTPTTGTFTTITGQTEVLKGTGNNLLLRSQALATAPWFNGGLTSIANDTTDVTDPLGGNTATKIVATGTSSAVGQPLTLSTLPYSGSIYLRTLSGSVTAQLIVYLGVSPFTNIGTTSVTITSSWQRFTVTTSTATNTSYNIQLNSISAGTIYAWGAQMEIGSVTNTYIPTTTTAVYGTPSLSFSGVAGIGLESNGALYVSPAGTGAIQAQATTSSTVGGNARGANAVDWQTSRSAATNVASGAYSVIGGGFSNTASNSYSVVGGGYGNSVTTNTQYASILGGVGLGASGFASTAVGGWGNVANGAMNFVGGGYNNSGTSASAVTTQSATMNATTAVTLAASNASIKVGQYITGTSIAGGTYVAAISGTSLTLSVAASGSSTSTLSFYTPHGVVVGGGNNQATGSYSFIGGGGDAGTAANRNTASGDWSVVGGGIANQATGIGAFIGGGGVGVAGTTGNIAGGNASAILGGGNHTSSGLASAVLGGYGNLSSGSYSATLGFYASTRGINGNFAFSSGRISTGGDNQGAILILKAATTDATPTIATSNNTTASGTNQVTLPNNSAYYFTGEVVSGVTGGGNSKGWEISGLIKRGANAAATTLVGSTATSLYADAGAATWTIALAADTTNGGLKVTFTGQAATTIRTVCQIRTTEMTY